MRNKIMQDVIFDLDVVDQQGSTTTVDFSADNKLSKKEKFFGKAEDTIPVLTLANLGKMTNLPSGRKVAKLTTIELYIPKGKKYRMAKLSFEGNYFANTFITDNNGVQSPTIAGFKNLVELVYEAKQCDFTSLNWEEATVWSIQGERADIGYITHDLEGVMVEYQVNEVKLYHRKDLKYFKYFDPNDEVNQQRMGKNTKLSAEELAKVED